MRLAIVTNIPTHYREPLYARIEELLATDGGGLHVVYAARRDLGQRFPAEATTASFATTYLGDEIPRLRGRAVLANPRVLGALEQTHPDVVVMGGYAPWAYIVAAWARARRVPLLIWSAETLRTAEVHGRRSLRRRPLLAAAAGSLAYGPGAAAYLVALGAHEESVTVVGNGIDVDLFAERTEQVRPEREELREKLGFSGPTVLSVGGKGLGVAAEAARAIGACVAVVGPHGAGLPGVRHLGMVMPSAMPRVYAAVDCLVHLPDWDRWPHAINEALAAGIPVVASPYTGVAADALTGPGCTVVPPDVGRVGSALSAALDVDHVTSPDIREAIRSPLRPWSVGPMAERFVAAARTALR